MRIALAFAVVGLCTVLGLWILGVIGAGDAFDGAARTIALVAVVAGGLAVVFRLMGGGPAGPSPRSDANGPTF